MTPDHIGRIVRASRRSQGLRQDQLAGAAGVGVRFLSELEVGKTTVQLGKGACGSPGAGMFGADRAAAHRGLLPARLMTKRVNVWHDGDLVGVLRYDRRSTQQFEYTYSWRTDPLAPPVSRSLPRGHWHWPTDRCRPYFEGLLPQGVTRSEAAAALGVSSDDTIRLLAALGAEVSGALTLLPEGEDPVSGGPDCPAHPLSEGELVRILDAIQERPFLVGREDRLRVSLAGARTKHFSRGRSAQAA